MLYLILAVILLITVAYFHAKHKYSYWSNLGIPGPTPLYPLGNFFTRLLNEPLALERCWAAKYGPIYGVYNFFKPSLVILDPQLIKRVLITDFPHFINRFNIPVYNDLWNQNLLFSRDEQWKRMRTITTPAFTRGKLKGMHNLMNCCVEKLCTYFEAAISIRGGVISTKEVVIGFTIDVIASTTFATETDSNNVDVKRGKNPIVVNGRKLFTLFPIRRAILFIMPKFILDLLGIKDFLDPQPFDYFTNLVKYILGQRKNEVNGVQRNDLVQLFLDAAVDEQQLKRFDQHFSKLEVDLDGKESKTVEPTTEPIKNRKNLTLTETEIIANCIFVFAAGFETTATTISHLIFELAKNGDAQQRLYAELTEKLGNLDVNSDEYFEALMTDCEYLDAVCKEILRMYPPVTRLNRIANSDAIELNGIRLAKGQMVIIPCSAVHYCEDFYPEPERFNPDRFLPQNRGTLVPYTFLPFGLGPRNCIGIRFAYQEIKLCLAMVIRRFQLEMTPETPKGWLSYKKGSAFMEAKEFPIKLTRRV